jgi:hypothetical protein
MSKPQINEIFDVNVIEQHARYCIVKFDKNSIQYEGLVHLSFETAKSKKKFKKKFRAIIIRAQYDVNLFGDKYDFFDLEKI